MSNQKVYKVFLTGFSTQNLTTDKLNNYLLGKVEGLLKASVPNNKYQGYAFLQMKDKKSLKKILKLTKL